jgi:PAS domain S-box-containing protein
MVEDRLLAANSGERTGKLSESERDYRSLLETMSDATWTTDQEGRIVFVSPNVTRIYGYSPEEIYEAGDSVWFGRIHPDDRPHVQEAFNALLKGNKAFDVEYRIQRKDGNWIWLHDRSVSVYEKNGVRYADGLFSDITEHKRTEEALRASEERYRLLFEKSPLGIGLASADGRIVSANEVMQTITGYSAVELRKIRLADTYQDPADRERLLEVLKRDGAVINQSAWLKRRDGTPYCALLSVSRICIAGKDFLQTTCIDITERKEAEEARARFAAIVESSDDAIIGKTLDGVITSWNRAAEKLYGYSAEEAIGKSISLLLPPNHPGELAKILERVARGEGVQHFETERVRKDGQIVSVSLTVSAIRDSTGRIVGASTFARDITERKRGEEALRESISVLRATLESTADGILVVDREGKIRSFNRRFAELWRIPEPVLETKDSPELRQFVAGQLEDPKQFVEKTQELYDEAERESVDTLRFKDGRVFERYSQPQRVEEEIVGRVWSFRDVTERKLAEQKLRLQGEIVENMFEGVVLTRASDGVIVYANSEYEEMLGYGSGELIGKNIATINASTSDKTPEDVAREIQTSLKETGVWNGEVLNVKKDGALVWCRAKVSTIESSQYGNVWVAALEDITEHKRAEEALRLSEAKYRALVDNASDFIFSIGSKNEVIAINPAGARFLGKTVEQVLGKSLLNVYPKEIATVFSENVRAVLQTGKGRNTDERVVFRGNELWINTRLEPLLDEKGGVYVVTGIARDISERKRIEDKLHRYSENLEQLVVERTGKLAESEKRFRELADMLPQTVFETDENSNLTYLNRAGSLATGYTQEDTGGNLNFPELFVKEQRDKVKEDLRQLLAGEELGAHEHTMQNKDDNAFPIVMHAAPVVRGGKTVGVRGIVIDITDRKRAEEELRATKERLESVVASNPAVIYTARPLPDESDYALTYLSDRVLPMLGYAPSDFLGHPEFWESHVPPEDVIRVRASMSRLWKEGRSAEEYQFLHKDGTYRWIREEANVIRDRDGEPIEVNGYWTDVTERKQMEEKLRLQSEALKDSEERFRTIAETSFDGILTVDLDGKITYASPAVGRITGYRDNELLGASMQKFLPESEIPNLIRIFNDAMTGEAAERVELNILKKNGSTARLEFSGSPIFKGGELIGLEAVARDITERRRMEARLAEAQRLAAIGETTAMVGHDLRNPLQGIASTLYLAKKMIESPKAAERHEAKKLLEMLTGEVYYMDKIVSDLQYYAAPVKAKLFLTDAPQLIRKIASTMRIPKNVQVTIKSKKDTRRTELDEDLMRRVSTNLITNAIQAMPNGGRLMIKTSTAAGELMVSFQDTGVGIPEENLPKLFSLFFTTKAKGQGLGLPVCKRLVEAQGGTITVESKVGEGSTFTVRLPLKRQ